MPLTHCLTLLTLSALLLSGCGKAEKSAPVPESAPVLETDTTFIDTRDGQTYRKVKIGSQTWMAENLNFDMSISMCYMYDKNNCEKYGRLYDWNTAMKACPAGWHLPSYDEWTMLVDFAGGEQIAGTKLKSTSGWYATFGWGSASCKPATDDYGFSALPGGTDGGDMFYGGGFFDAAGSNGHWWSATEMVSKTFMAWSQNMNFAYEFIIRHSGVKASKLSVRCVRDD